MEEVLRLQAMNRRDRIRQDNLDSVRSMEYVVNDQLDNIVMVRSRNIQGIFGCFCGKYLSFEFQYNVRIGEEGTPGGQISEQSQYHWRGNKSTEWMSKRAPIQYASESVTLQSSIICR